ncbi:unnamed protein product [Ilex paraguariensis]|uniref:Uncharacterized protein n=1 Tax=Ilex paraguariensis TaxID=185542 RepID=A0ABC8RPF2_9AQUA
MAARLTSRLASHLLRATSLLNHPHPPLFTMSKSQPSIFYLKPLPWIASNLHRFFSTSRRQPVRSNRVDIGSRARQLQNRRLWTYAVTFSSIAGFIIIVLNQFEDSLVFYVTPTDALTKYTENPTKNKFRLGGLVLEGSVSQPGSEMEFVITDLITDILVKYQGSLPDLFREGHSVVVEGFVKPITEEIKRENLIGRKSVSEKARSVECYFAATEVLAKHDEKYMPQEVAAVIEKNKKKIEAASEEGRKERPATEA